MTREQSQKLVEKILGFSKSPECDVSVDTAERAYIRFANNGITTSGFNKNRTINITSTREGRSGSVEITDTGDDALKAAMARSEELASIAPPNPEHMPPLAAQEYPAVPDFDEDTAQARGPVMLPHVRAVIDAAQTKKLVAAGFFERSYTTAAVGNKNGLFGYHRATDARLSATVRAADGSSSGWDAQPAVRIREINGAAIAARAAAKCLEWRNPRRLDPGRYTVVLEPTAVNDLLRLIGGALLARSAEEGRSVFSKKGGGTLVGEKLFPEFITLRSDPLSGQSPATPWSWGLIPARPMTWIERGVIRNLAYDRYWASRTGKQPSPFPSALALDGGAGGTEDLVKACERGLLVTRFWYIRFVNPQTQHYTGLTRDGLFLIENGRIAAPAMNLRFNESPVDMLRNAVRLGRSIRARGGEGGSMIVPPMLTKDFNFTSVSDAV